MGGRGRWISEFEASLGYRIAPRNKEHEVLEGSLTSRTMNTVIGSQADEEEAGDGDIQGQPRLQSESETQSQAPFPFRKSTPLIPALGRQRQVDL